MNTLTSLEYSQLKSEHQKLMASKETDEVKYLDAEKERLSLKEQNQDLSKKIMNLSESNDKITIKTESLERKITALDLEVEVQAEKARKIAALNEELRDLIAQERNAYNEEKQRLEEEIEQAKVQSETKFKLARNKLIMVLQNEGYLKDLVRSGHEQVTMDEAIQRACDAILKIRRPVFNKENIDMTTIHERQKTITQEQSKDVSPIRSAVNDSKYYVNLHELSKYSAMKTDYQCGDYNSIKTSKTPSKFIKLQPCPQSSSKVNESLV